MSIISKRTRKSTSFGAPSKQSTISHRKTKSDDLVDPRRSALMARVRQRNSAPELEVRRILRGLNVSFGLHRKSLPGTPDITVPKLRYAIFIHGCFWHRHENCSKATTPKTRVAFWQSKFERNVARDARNIASLRKLGWKVIVIWECECRSMDKLTRRLARCLCSVDSSARKIPMR